MRPASALLPAAALLALGLPAQPAAALIAPGAVAPEFTKTALGGGAVSLSDHAGKVVVLFLFGYSCPICLSDGPSVEQNLNQYFQSRYPGEVQMLGADLWNGTPSQVTSFRNQTGATFPLLMLGATPTGGDLDALYGPFDNYVVINKQGVVRYHAALTWPHGNRYHIDEIRGCVDSLVGGTVDVPRGSAAGLALAAAPSPARGATTVTLTLPAGGPRRARVEVLDVSGRRRATLFDGVASSGVTRISWDGRGEGAGRLAPGVYLVAAEVSGERLVSRVVLLE